jgi:hypothetical protein
LLAVLALAAGLAPAGQARGARERSPEEEAAIVASKEAKRAEREQRAAARREQKQTEHEEAQARRQAERQERRVQNSTRVRAHGQVQFSCTAVHWKFTAFPQGSNTVQQVINIEGEHPSKIVRSFTFDGPSGETTTPISAPPGTYRVDAYAIWKSPGLKSSFDILGELTCRANPGLSIKKEQRIAGSNGGYVPTPLSGEVGDTVDYQMVVTNTGNVPMEISAFADPHCDAGTISGAPVGTILAVGASTTYLCRHVLGEAGTYTNTAEVSGIPPSGDGQPVLETSNTVVVQTPAPPTAPAPGFSIEKLQQIAGSSSPYTSSQLSGQVGQTIDYEILITNTGNVPLRFASFSDPQCDAGTLAGGTEGAALPAGASTTYTCSHVIDSTDATAGSYSNTVTVTGTPPTGEGEPVTSSSNTVVVTVPSAGTLGVTTTASPSGSSGQASSTTSSPSKSGVLAFKSATLPKLKGPQGCVRANSFHVSLRSAGVSSVGFYLDGHKLKTLTARNARKGLLTITIDAAKLKLGSHKLTARIKMAATASTKLTLGSRTIRILRCDPAAVTPKFTG